MQSILRISATLMLLLATVFAGAQAWAGRVGTEFRVTNFSRQERIQPSIAGLRNGGFVVVWAADRKDGDGFGVYGRRYNASGGTGAEVQVSTYTPDYQYNPSVAALNNGGFVVVWSSNGQDGDLYGIYGQRYNAEGVRVGNEFRINTTTTGYQDRAAVAALDGGGFIVAWHSQNGNNSDIHAQRFTVGGARAGPQIRVNADASYNHYIPSVAGLGNGGSVITWAARDQDGSFLGVYGQRFGATGARAGAEFLVNTRTTNNQYMPSVARLTDGFVVTWNSYLQDTSDMGVYGQSYNVAGARVGGEFRVNTTTAGTQTDPSVTGLGNGGFVVTWCSRNQDGDGFGVYGQRFTAAGAPHGAEFRVNTHWRGAQFDPSVAALADGGFIVTWDSQGQDGDWHSIRSQRYDR